MSSICPVLLIGHGDFSDLRAALQARGVGLIVAPSLDDARSMLRNFRVDAIVAFADDVEADALVKFATPVLIVGAHGAAGENVTFASDTSALVRILPELLASEAAVRGAA